MPGLIFLVSLHVLLRIGITFCIRTSKERVWMGEGRTGNIDACLKPIVLLYMNPAGVSTAYKS